MEIERWCEWDYIELLMDVVWEMSRGKEMVRPSWECCPCGDMLAILERLRVLPPGWVDPERAAGWLRQRMARASPKRLSERTGYSREHLNRLKTGRRGKPTFETFVRILLALDLGVPLLASLTQVRRGKINTSTQRKSRRSKKVKRRGRPRQRNANDFLSFRVSFWRTRLRDLKALWEDEVTESTAEVTDTEPLEVTLQARRVTPGVPEVTRQSRGAMSVDMLAPLTVEYREDDPPPDLRAVLNRLARRLEDEGPYPVSLSRVTEAHNERIRQMKDRLENERLVEELRAERLRAEEPRAEEHGPKGPSSKVPRAERPSSKGAERLRLTRGSSPSASTRSAPVEHPEASRGPVADAPSETILRPRSSDTIPMIFRGVCGYFEPLDPQPDLQPAGVIRVIPESPPLRRRSSAAPRPAHGLQESDPGADSSSTQQTPPDDQREDRLRESTRDHTARDNNELNSTTDIIAEDYWAELHEKAAAISSRWRTTSLGEERPKPAASLDGPRKPKPRPVSTADRLWRARVPGLPTKREVPGFDLARNWGATPDELRPLFALMERVSKIQGSARIFALISKLRASFQTDAHRDSGFEVSTQRAQYKLESRDKPPLTCGDAAVDFGSGGLFRASALSFLWSGIRELKDNAPLLSAPPEVIYIPRLAAFGAVLRLQQLLTNHHVSAPTELMIGWENDILLKETFRGDLLYKRRLESIQACAESLRIDLKDTATIPRRLCAKSWPGVARVFTDLTGITLKNAADD